MTFLGDVPQTAVTLAVWSYWSCVCVLVVRSHLRFRTSAGGLPRTARERWMWALWVPAIVLWQILPAVAASSTSMPLATPELALTNPLLMILRLTAAAVGVIAFGLTIPCWLGMGKNWSMAIVPGKRCRLITTGMFTHVRHPIYALSILLMLATMLVTLTPAMTLVGVIHITMLSLKAASEERYLTLVHGDDYRDYCRKTGRFVPRAFRASESAEDCSGRKAA